MQVVLDGQSSPLYITNARVPRESILGPTLFLVFINDLTGEVLPRIGIYADDTTQIPVLVSLGIFEKVESDLPHIVELGDMALKMNSHRDPLLVPVEMNGIELPEEFSFGYS